MSSIGAIRGSLQKSEDDALPMFLRHTILSAPATKTLIKIEGCRAMAELDVREPFGDDV